MMPKLRTPNPKLEDKRVIANQARYIRSLERQLREAIAERDLLTNKLMMLRERISV